MKKQKIQNVEQIDAYESDEELKVEVSGEQVIDQGNQAGYYHLVIVVGAKKILKEFRSGHVIRYFVDKVHQNQVVLKGEINGKEVII